MNLPEEILQRARAVLECTKSFEYFVDNYCVIQDRASQKAIPFKLWEGQKSVVPSIIHEKRLIVLKARQLGLTWLVAAFVLWRAMFNANELIVIVSGGREEIAVEFLDRVKYMFDALPVWMKPKVMVRNQTQLQFGAEITDKETGEVKTEGLNSIIKSVPSTPDAGQSKTISLLIMDESALNRHCKEIYAAANPTLEHANGDMIVISNPSKDKPGWSWTRKLYTSSMNGENDFTRIFLDWRCVPGRGDDFLDKKRREGLDEDELINQYPSTEEEAISAVASSYFGKALTGHEAVAGDPFALVPTEDVKRMELVPQKNGIVEIWEQPYDRKSDWDGVHWTKRYCVGSDISEGLGQTFSVGYVLDRLSNSLVARVRSNRLDAAEWAKVLFSLSCIYHSAGDLSLICPERTGAGQTTVKELKNLGANLYMKLVPDTAGKEVQKQYGWSETRQSKHILAGDLRTWFKSEAGAVRCGVLLAEASTFIRREDGSLGHEEGETDDAVMAAGCAIQASLFLGASPRETGESVFAKQKRIEQRESLDTVSKAAWSEVDKVVAEAERSRMELEESFSLEDLVW